MELKFGKYKGQMVTDVAKIAEGRTWLKWFADKMDLEDPKWGAMNKKAREYVLSVLNATVNNTNHEKPVAKPTVTSVTSGTPATAQTKMLGDIYEQVVKINVKLAEIEKIVRLIGSKNEANEVAEEFGGEVVNPEDILWKE